MEIYDEIKNAKRIVIYGTGSISDLLYAYLCMEGIDNKLVAFTVSNRQGIPSTKNGVPVIEVGNLSGAIDDFLLVIAVHDKTINEIKRTASKYGYSNIAVAKAEDIRQALYGKLYELPIEKNKIFVSNYHGMGYGCNPKYIVSQLLQKDINDEIDIVWGVRGNHHSFPDRIRTVQIGTFEYYKELATARVWIDNVRKTDEINKREGQFYIQTWHGAAPFKKVEGDLLGKAPESVIEMGKRDSTLADLFISGSKFYTNLYRTSFWYYGEIMESGLPRQDVFWGNISEIRRNVRKYLKIEENKVMVMYSPTFRDDLNADYYDLEVASIKKAIKKRFNKEAVFCISKHPLNSYINYSISKEDYIDVSQYDDFEELLVAADILITDYSGCIYDFSFTGNPAFLFQPDLEKMKLRRDFYVPLEDMPYPAATNMEGLIENILTYDENVYKKTLKQFMDLFGNYDDGHASERIADRILDVIKNPDR